MANKNVFLLSKAVSYELKDQSEYYDEARSINMINVNGIKSPLVLSDMNTVTQSKTMAAPGDDDPDPDDERCY